MKKLSILFLIICLGLVAGCTTNTTGSTDADTDGASEQQPTESAVATDAAATDAATTGGTEDGDLGHAHAVTPEEPGTEERCSICNMVVYGADHPMGRYTGQVVTADGEHLFTDDVGCLLNQIRVLEEEPLAAWVRDYNTLEWIPVDEAVPVRASIETPMKMGFALFGSEEAAEQFISENPMLSPVMATMEEVDSIALERRKAKMAQQAEQEQMEQDHGNMDNSNN